MRNTVVAVNADATTSRSPSLLSLTSDEIVWSAATSSAYGELNQNCSSIQYQVAA